MSSYAQLLLDLLSLRNHCSDCGTFTELMIRETATNLIAPGVADFRNGG